MLDDQRQEELRSLIEARWEGTLDEEGLSRLEAMVCGDEAACRFYLDYSALHGLLVLQHASDRPCASERAIFEPLPAEMMDARSAGDKPRSPILGFLSDRIQQGMSFLSGSNAYTILVALGLPGLVISVLVISLINQGTPALPGPVATIARTCDSVGSLGNGPTDVSAGRTLMPGQRLTLQRGLVEIEFTRGARAIVEAPAVFEFQHDNGGYLQTGRLSAVVPTEARGFTVETPLVTVVDLGTNFGISVSADGTAEAHVFEGQIEVATKTMPDNPTPLVRRLRAGQAARVLVSDAQRVAASIESIPASSDEFVRWFPEAERITPLPDAIKATSRLIASVDRRGGVPGNRNPIGPFDGETDPLPSGGTGLAAGVVCFSDRLYPVVHVAEPLIGAEFVRTFNMDKNHPDACYDVTFSTDRKGVFLMVLVDDRFEQRGRNQRAAVDAIVSQFAEPGSFRDTELDVAVGDPGPPKLFSAFGMKVPTRDETGTPIVYTFGAVPPELLGLKSYSNYIIAVMPETPGLQTGVKSSATDRSKDRLGKE